jgi:hypothetical protein
MAERARRPCFDLAVPHDLLVHNFGSRTFRGNGIDADHLLDENGRHLFAGLREFSFDPWGRLQRMRDNARAARLNIRFIQENHVTKEIF